MGRTRRNLHTLASRARKKTSTRHLISSTTLWGHRLARVPASFTSIVRSEGKSTNARGYWSRAKAKRTRKRNSGSRGRRTPVRQRRRQPRRGQRDRRRNRTPKETRRGTKTRRNRGSQDRVTHIRRTPYVLQDGGRFCQENSSEQCYNRDAQVSQYKLQKAVVERTNVRPCVTDKGPQFMLPRE